MWCSVAIMNAEIICVYRHLFTNHLHGKAAELCLANSRNNRVTTTKYMSKLIASKYSFYHAVLVKFYCDVITRCHLQLINTSINTSINTFFSKFRTFLAEQRRRGRPVMVKRKLDGAVDESSADRKICKLDATLCIL